MEPGLLGLIGLLVLFVMIFAFGIPIGFSMAIVGFVGIMLLSGTRAGWGSLGTIPYSTVASYTLSIIPMFVLMGEFAFASGIVSDAYRSLNKLVGHLPGGLAVATIAGCGGFAACCGSSVACATVMIPVAWPEMRKYRYSSSLALGTIAAGGTLGILIPPSVPFVVYGMLSDQSIGKLLISGVIPGILLALLFVATIIIITIRNPSLAPRTPSANWKDRVTSLKGLILISILILIILGGIWGGVFTPNEAGAVAALAAFLIALARKKLNLQTFFDCLGKTARTTAMIFTIMIGAMIFNGFMAMTKLPITLADFIGSLNVSPTLVVVAILLLYVILGCIMDVLGMVLLTVPILLPVLINLHVDLIWFGVLLTIMTEMALITPPIGVNVFVIGGMAPEVPMYTIFKGIAPFVGAMVACVALIVVFPQIALFLPGVMRGG